MCDGIVRTYIVYVFSSTCKISEKLRKKMSSLLDFLRYGTVLVQRIFF